MFRRRRSGTAFPGILPGLIAAFILGNPSSGISEPPSAEPVVAEADEGDRAVSSDAPPAADAEPLPETPPRARRRQPPVLPEVLAAQTAAATPLNAAKSVFLDKDHRRLLLVTQVCLREGLLEMFLCKAQTKEHESVLTIDSDAAVIHAGLLALGAEPGRPVRFDPEFQPPQGDRIDLRVYWVDADGKLQSATAQQWVRGLTRRYFVEPFGPLPKGLVLEKYGDLRYDPTLKELLWFGMMSGEQRDALFALSEDEAFRDAVQKFYERSQPRELEADFIFGGSGFAELKDGTKWYQAEGGTLICVANFGDAMIDVSVRSSDVNADASFEPYTERIPPLGTTVLLELLPQPRETRNEGGAAASDSGEAGSADPIDAAAPPGTPSPEAPAAPESSAPETAPEAGATRTPEQSTQFEQSPAALAPRGDPSTVFPRTSGVQQARDPAPRRRNAM